MIKKIKEAVLIIVTVTFALTPVALPATAYAQDPQDPANINQGLCDGASFQIDSTCNPQETGEEAKVRINNLIQTVINILSIVVGVVSVVMIIIGGLKYITSGGDSGNVTGAKNTILYAVIGLVIVALAQFIVRFVIGRTAGLGSA